MVTHESSSLFFLALFLENFPYGQSTTSNLRLLIYNIESWLVDIFSYFAITSSQSQPHLRYVAEVTIPQILVLPVLTTVCFCVMCEI